MYDISEIKKEIKESKKLVYWYQESSPKPKLILTGDSKKKTKSKIERANIKDGQKFIRLSISFHTGQKIGQGGKIAIKTNTYIVENKSLKRKNWDENINGEVWFPDEFLDRSGWKEYFFDNIAFKVNNGSIKFGFSIVKYNKNF